MTEADLLRCIEAVDRRRERDEYQKRESGRFLPAGPCEPTGKSAAQTAKIVGTSETKVKRARRVLSDTKEKKAVLAGKKSINKASEDITAKKNEKPVESPNQADPEKPRGKGGRFEVQPIIMKAWRELRAWRKKYAECMELNEIFSIIDRQTTPTLANVPGQTVNTPQEASNAFLEAIWKGSLTLIFTTPNCDQKPIPHTLSLRILGANVTWSRYGLF